MENWFVYIIECQNGRYYTGISNNIEQRFKKHLQGKGALFTKRNPVKAVIYTEFCGKMGDALKREAAIKKLSRSMKESLIDEKHT